ncbi:MAG: HAD-IIIA family hydrolase [Capnocytophaga sp.]|nr:HAD-IIIA family hydrolase [Capnocytophaga sp.]
MENKNFKEYLKDINTFIFDIDGVMTSCHILVNTQGELLRTMNVRDGFALKQAVNKGYNICIITGGTNEGARIRFNDLGIFDVYMGNNHKMIPFNDYISKKNINPDHILYMGDDIPDVLPMKAVGLPTCPQDAVPEVKKVAKYISHKNGGYGAVRDVIEQVLKVQGNWDEELR